MNDAGKNKEATFLMQRMRELNNHVSPAFAGLFILLLLTMGCAGGALKNLAPIYPAEKLDEFTKLDATNPEQFEIPAKTPILIMTKDDIEVAIAYWRQYDLNRKYHRGNAASPFYASDALHQGEKTDVFYVKITNNRPQKILFDVRKCKIEDQGENWYGAQDYEDLVERFGLMSRVTGLHVTNGLAIARRVLLEKQIGKIDEGIPPGQSIEGFLPFYQTKLNARALTIMMPIEKAPPENTTQRFKTIEFHFPFVHSESIRHAQPTAVRY
jgi:hypothetical protein